MLDLVEELGLTKDTIVIFTSDNGTTHLKLEVDYDFFESVGNLRGLKGSLYEGGIRVPLIVKWPGKIKAGSVTDRMTGFEDWLVTLHTLIEAKKPLPSKHDGFEQAQHLLGKSRPGPAPVVQGVFRIWGTASGLGRQVESDPPKNAP